MLGLNPRIRLHPTAGSAGSGLSPQDENQLRIGQIRQDVEGRFGVTLNQAFVTAVTDLSDYYRSLSVRFKAMGINDVAFTNRRAVLTAAQQELLFREGPGMEADIERISQRIRAASGAIGRIPSLGEKPTPEVAAHAAFAQQALQPELTESAFGAYRLSPDPTVQQTGQIVSVAILLKDPFLRNALLQQPGIQALADKLPIDPKTLTGTVVERSLLDVPVARDYHQRLAQAAAFKTALINNRGILGLAQADELVLVNAPCGTGLEDANLLAANAANPHLSSVLMILRDLSPTALGLTRARIQMAQQSVQVAPPTIDIGALDLGNLGERILGRGDAVFDLLTPTTHPVPPEKVRHSHYFFAGGLIDYFNELQTRGLLVAMALNSVPGGYGHVTQIDADHPHRPQQYYLVDWNLNARTGTELAAFGEQLRIDLDALRAVHGARIPQFAGRFDPKITDMNELIQDPAALAPGSFAVATYVEPGTGRRGTHLNLMLRFGA